MSDLLIATGLDHVDTLTMDIENNGPLSEMAPCTTPTPKSTNLPTLLGVTSRPQRSNLITIGAKDGFLFVRGSGFLAQANVPTWITGAGWFHVPTALDVTQGAQGGTFTVTMGANFGLYLQLNSMWVAVWMVQSTRGLEIGLDGTWAGTWTVQP